MLTQYTRVLVFSIAPLLHFIWLRHRVLHLLLLERTDQQFVPELAKTVQFPCILPRAGVLPILDLPALFIDGTEGGPLHLPVSCSPGLLGIGIMFTGVQGSKGTEGELIALGFCGVVAVAFTLEQG
jgi:hypothetical protein